MSKVYSIPVRYRKVENLHILLWLLKDTCWALSLKIPGMIMIVPTFVVAVVITWQTRHTKSELFHNLAIDFWITANCTWMVGEFFGWDENIWLGLGLREASLLPFGIGLLTLLYYYLIYRRNHADDTPMLVEVRKEESN